MAAATSGWKLSTHAPESMQHCFCRDSFSARSHSRPQAQLAAAASTRGTSPAVVGTLLSTVGTLCIGAVAHIATPPALTSVLGRKQKDLSASNASAEPAAVAALVSAAAPFISAAVPVSTSALSAAFASIPSSSTVSKFATASASASVTAASPSSLSTTGSESAPTMHRPLSAASRCQASSIEARAARAGQPGRQSAARHRITIRRLDP
eukprot:6202798-Pleurochrysis_carterae.AAC.2